MPSLGLLMKPYITKWKGDPCSCKEAVCPESGKCDIPGTDETGYNFPNGWAAPRGSCPGMSLNEIPADYPHNTMQSCPRANSSCCNKFNPNPIRHYRRSYSNPRGKIPTGTTDIPGGVIFRSGTASNNCVQNESSCGLEITSSFSTKPNLLTDCPNNTGTCGTPGTALARVRNGTSLGTKHCNESRTSIQSDGQKPNLYYSDSRSYLRARCTTFEKKQMTTRPEVNVGEYKTGCGQPASCCTSTYYKPCNSKFSTNGAVSSSTRLLELTRTTINKAAKNTAIPFGKATASASQYSSRRDAPYTNKSNYAPPAKRIHSVNGVQQLCC